MTAKKKRIGKATVNQAVAKNNRGVDWLYRTAFWGLALLLLFPPYFRGLFFAPEQEKALIFAALVFWLTFLWSWLRSGQKFLRGPLDYFALALPVVYILSSFVAVNKGLAIDEVVKNILYFLVYWSASRLIRNQEDVHKLLHVIYISAIGVALAGLATAAGIINIQDGFNVAQYGGFISSTFQYHNALATYLSAVFIIGTYLWYQSFSTTNTGQVFGDQGWFANLKVPNYLYACGNLLLLTVLLASKSRAGLLVFALVFAVYLLGAGSQRRFYMLLMTGGLSVVAYILSAKFISLVQESSNHGQAWLWIAGGILLALAAQFLLSVIHNLLNSKWDDNPKKYLVAFASLIVMVIAAGLIWISGKPGFIDKITSFDFLWTAYHRMYYMESAMEMIKQRPILGWGGGGWQEAYEAFLNFRYTTRQAHSYYFQVGVETGFAGIAIVLGIWISYIALTCGIIRKYVNDMFRRQLIWLFLVIFLMIGGHALIDFDLSLSAITIVLWCVFGMTSALATPVESKSQLRQNSLKYLSPIVATVFMIIIFCVAGILAQANSLAETGYRFLSSNNADQGIEYIGKASSFNPYNSNYHMILSKAYANQDNPKIALVEAKMAVNQSKYSFNTRNNYIQIALVAGENSLAARENKRIYGLAPNDIEAYEEYAKNYLNLGIKELQSGNRNAAKEDLNKVLDVSSLISRREKILSDIDKSLWEGPLLKETDKIYLVKGQAAYCLGMFSDSLGYLQQAAQTQNSDINGQALLWQALVQERKGNKLESNKLIDQINTLKPQLVQSYMTLKNIPVL